jgi:predicted RNA-binding Zn-ribbon protein involved in translation (DUF1610 family)
MMYQMMDWNWGSNFWFYMILGMGIFFLICIILVYVLIRRRHQYDSSQVGSRGNHRIEEKVKIQDQSNQKSASAGTVEDINQETTFFCPTCGEKLDDRTLKYCPSCGSEI